MRPPSTRFGPLGLPIGPIRGALRGFAQRTDRVVIGFEALPSPEELAALGDVVTVNPALRFAVLRGSGVVDAAVRRYAVRYAQPDPRVPLLVSRTRGPPDDALYAQQYGPQLIGAPAVWRLTTGSVAVRIGVVDTGVRYSHEDLTGRFGGGLNLIAGTTDPLDDYGHGTHVTGTAAATLGNTRGIAGITQATFLAVKALDSTGHGYATGIATGIQWLADHGCDVINASVGGVDPSQAEQDAIDYAWAKGSVVVAAAGNEGPCSNCVLYPGKYAHLTVACVDASKQVCGFSSAGPEVDLAAPGSAILSTYYSADDAYVQMWGTSMSTPHVTVAYALLRSVAPRATRQAILAALLNTAQGLGYPAEQQGKGLVRVDLAAEHLLSHGLL